MVEYHQTMRDRRSDRRAEVAPRPAFERRRVLGQPDRPMCDFDHVSPDTVCGKHSLSFTVAPELLQVWCQPRTYRRHLKIHPCSKTSRRALSPALSISPFGDPPHFGRVIARPSFCAVQKGASTEIRVRGPVSGNLGALDSWLVPRTYPSRRHVRVKQTRNRVHGFAPPALLDVHRHLLTCP